MPFRSGLANASGRLKSAIRSKKNDRKEILNDNILTENRDDDNNYDYHSHDNVNYSFRNSGDDNDTIDTSKDSIFKRSLRFLKKKRESNSSPTTEASFVQRDPPSADEPEEADEESLQDTVTVFEVFEQVTSCRSPVDDRKELLARIAQLQKELEVSQNTVKDLNDELDQIYTEKDDAVLKLDEILNRSRLEMDFLDQDELREVRMMLTERTEQTGAENGTSSFWCMGMK